MSSEAAGYVKDWDGTYVPVKRFSASVASATTDGSLIAAVASKRLRILTLQISTGAVATTVTINTKGAGAGTAISAAMALGASSTVPWLFNPHGEFLTSSGEALTATTSASGVTTVFHGSYIESSEP